MRAFKDGVAVVTGAASGIGRAMVERFVREGMKVVLADVEEEPLAQLAAELRATGATVLALPTDVANGAAVEALADQAESAFGVVHLVCNNAGVAVTRRAWELSTADWDWVLNVNLWGVIHGVRVFVPRLLAHQSEGHIVNTASVAGLFAWQGIAAYNVSKAGVVALSETLAQDLAQAGARIKVSVLCPGFVQTQLPSAARNRPGQGAAAPPQDDAGPFRQLLQQAALVGMTPPSAAAEIAQRVFEAVRDERFYVLPHPGYAAFVEERMTGIMVNTYPQPLTPEAVARAQSAVEHANVS